MSEHLGFGILFFQFENLFQRKFLVHAAGTVPDDHIAAGHAADVVAQIAVGRKNDLRVGRQAADHVHRVARRTADIGQRLDPDRRIDVRHDRMSRIAFQELGEILRPARIGQRASRGRFGQKHLLVRRQYLGGLGHKVHAGEQDDPRIGPGGLLRQRQAVAREIGYALHFGQRIVVRQNYRAFLFLQPDDPGGQFGFRRRKLVVDSHFSFSFVLIQ